LGGCRKEIDIINYSCTRHIVLVGEKIMNVDSMKQHKHGLNGRNHIYNSMLKYNLHATIFMDQGSNGVGTCIPNDQDSRAFNRN